LLKKEGAGLMSTILPTQEAEIRKITVGS
jgi:hypothetical protein